jgi:hypothetical protein
LSAAPIFDRDSIFSAQVVSTVKSFGIKTARTAYRSPWQNGVAERWVGASVVNCSTTRSRLGGLHHRYELAA